jgi:hypothetical protein
MVSLKWIQPQVISGLFPNGYEFRCLQPSGNGLRYSFLSRRGGYRSSSGRRSRNKLRCVLFIPTQTALAGIEKNRQDAASENEGARKEPARRCSETAVAESSAHFPIEKSVELREACGKPCLIQI